jgi:dephospho-CoA kinase
MLKVGITGGIGAGKSIVCHMFEQLGIPVYDSDSRAKWVMHHDKVLREELKRTFGTDSYTVNGELNRPYLASVVFKDPEQLALLNKLVHPHVKSDFTQWAENNKQAPYVVKEAALMYESEAWRQMDQIITVYAPLPTRIKRILARDSHRTEADIKAIINKQLQEEEKMTRAEHIIYNDDKHLIIPQVLELHELFRAAAVK